MEILDISLSEEVKSLVFPLLDPNFLAAQRVERLEKIFSLPELELDMQLEETISNSTGAWQNVWVRACAIYAAGQMNVSSCVQTIEKIRQTESGILQETAAWALERMSSIYGQAYPVSP